MVSWKVPCSRSRRPFRRGSLMVPARAASTSIWPASERSPPRNRSQIGWICPLIETLPDIGRLRAIASLSGTAEASTGSITSTTDSTAPSSRALAWIRRVLSTSRAFSAPFMASPRGASILRTFCRVTLAEPDRSSPVPRRATRPVTRPRILGASEPSSTLVRSAWRIAALESWRSSPSNTPPPTPRSNRTIRPSPDRATTAGLRVLKAISRTRPPPRRTMDWASP